MSVIQRLVKPSERTTRGPSESHSGAPHPWGSRALHRPRRPGRAAGPDAAGPSKKCGGQRAAHRAGPPSGATRRQGTGTRRRKTCAIRRARADGWVAQPTQEPGVRYEARCHGRRRSFQEQEKRMLGHARPNRPLSACAARRSDALAWQLPAKGIRSRQNWRHAGTTNGNKQVIIKLDTVERKRRPRKREGLPQST